MIKGGKVDLNFQKNSLQIKTTSTPGSGDKVSVQFYDNADEEAGGFEIIFGQDSMFGTDSKMIGLIGDCSNGDEVEIEINTSAPDKTEKVWTIHRTDNLMKMECDGVLVLKYNTSHCAGENKERWEKKVGKISFEERTDTASRQYRPWVIARKSHFIGCWMIDKVHLKA